MESRTLNLLEFPKVLKHLSSHAVSRPGADACLKIRPLENSRELAPKIGYMRQGLAFYAETGFKLGSFPSLDGMFKFLQQPGAVLDLEALFALKMVLEQVEDAAKAAANDPKSLWPELAENARTLARAELTASGLSRCLDQDGNIKDESSPELFWVRREIRGIHRQCTKKAGDFLQKRGLADYLQDEYITLSSDRYVLPLKTNFKGRLQGIIHDYSQTGETCYFEPMFLVELNNRLQEMKQEEREAEQKVLGELTSLVLRESDAIQASYAWLVDMDVLQAKAALAKAFETADVPEIFENAPIRLVNARHPLLVLSGHGVVPVDLELEPGQKALIITGGNAGGKTVALKTLGLVSLMTMCALPTPVAEGSSLPMWTRVFVFMGDEQSLEDHVSTFTAQIRHMSRAWPAVGEGTLVILDEFGAGTDPAQGAALAQAVLDELLEMGAHVAAATHFPALKAYGLANPKFRAASVLFDPATKRPLFRLAYDQVGASQALDVAKEHGLPEKVLDRARQYMLLDGEDTGKILERLNELAVDRGREIKKLKDEREKLADKTRRLEDKFEREKTALISEIRDQARGIVRQWQAGRIGRKQAQKQLAETRKALAGPEKPIERDEVRALSFDRAEVGQPVAYVPWGKKGVVRDRDDKRGQVKVDLDGVCLWVAPEDLVPADNGGGESVPSGKSAPGSGSMSMHLDLRGKRADTAIGELAKFIDDAVLRGLESVEIIHGRGTGALRREVHNFLKDFAPVESFSLAPEDRGGDGMTVVDLK